MNETTTFLYKNLIMAMQGLRQKKLYQIFKRTMAIKVMKKLYIHTKWFISLLEPTASKKLEGVYILTQVEFTLLVTAEGDSRNVGLPRLHPTESYLLTHGVHHQLTIQRKGCHTNNGSLLMYR